MDMHTKSGVGLAPKGASLDERLWDQPSFSIGGTPDVLEHGSGAAKFGGVFAVVNDGKAIANATPPTASGTRCLLVWNKTETGCEVRFHVDFELNSKRAYSVSSDYTTSQCAEHRDASSS